MDAYAIGMVIGILIGLAIGISLGISIGKKQKPWSELTEEEKKYKKIIIGTGIIILLIGFIINIWLFFNW
jgi:uncharacterized BrkB/YihY/UPF0761 family membrane protein